MIDVLKSVIGYIPKYLLCLGSMVASPRSFLNRHHGLTDDSWSSSLLFFFLSVLLSVLLISVSVVGTSDMFLERSVKDVIELFLKVLTVSVAVFVAWLVVFARLSFKSVLRFSLYVYGAFTIVTHVLYMFVIGLINSRDRVIIDKLVAARNSGADGKALVKEMLDFNAHPIMEYVVVLGLIYYVMALVWYWFAWRALADLASVGFARALLAFILAGTANFALRYFVPFLGYSI